MTEARTPTLQPVLRYMQPGASGHGEPPDRVTKQPRRGKIGSDAVSINSGILWPRPTIEDKKRRAANET